MEFSKIFTVAKTHPWGQTLESSLKILCFNKTFSGTTSIAKSAPPSILEISLKFPQLFKTRKKKRTL
jgi:hypothetical protein